MLHDLIDRPFEAIVGLCLHSNVELEIRTELDPAPLLFDRSRLNREVMLEVLGAEILEMVLYCLQWQELIFQLLDQLEPQEMVFIVGRGGSTPVRGREQSFTDVVANRTWDEPGFFFQIRD